MTDLLLALVPDYGLYIITCVVFLAAIGVPLPSSILVLTSGSLAASGDLVLTQLLLATLGAFVLGDQTAYYIGRKAGPAWLDKLRSKKRLTSAVTRSESIYQQYGVLAILLSRTIFSPCGPYIAYISGVWQMKPAMYSAVAFVGASTWTILYVGLGYVFAGNIPELSNLIASILMVSVAALFTFGFAIWLFYSWRKFSFET